MSDTIIQTAIICLTIVMVFYIMAKVMIAEYSVDKKEVEKVLKQMEADGLIIIEQSKNSKENAQDE